jgi:hypothetical protein
MPNFKSNAAYHAWLAYGHANGLFEKTPGHQDVSIKGKDKKVKHEMALGGPLPGVKPGTPYPYDLYAALVSLPKDKKALGGPTVLNDNILASTEDTGVVPGSLYGALGSIASDLVGGNTNIADNREKGVAEGTLSGALQGAGQGASMGATLGSIVPGIGTAIGTGIGAGAGAIIGGIKGNKNKKDEIQDFQNSMELRNSTLHPLATTYKAAYGVNVHDLPEQAGLKGDPTEYNGHSHEEGGIPVGNVEVEDGEVRVGDYIFSDRLIDPETKKTYAELAKKVTRKYTEYPNDGPAKRTQEKLLKDIQFKNDQARLLQQKADAEMRANMEQDYAAYGAMISKDPAGKYVVDKENRIALLEAAKNRKMSYNSYIDNLYACGGDIKEKMAAGGKYPNPADLYSALNIPNAADELGYTDFTGMGSTDEFTSAGTDFSSAVEPSKNASAPILGFSAPYSEHNYFNSLDPSTASMSMSMVQPTGLDSDITLPKKAISSDLANLEADKTINSGAMDVNGSKMDPSQYMQMLKKKFGTDEKALLASNLPAIANLINSTKHGDTTFDRAHLNTISLEAERQGVKDAIVRARNIQGENIRNIATSSGDALAALSAGNAGLTGQEMAALRESYANEANANVGIKNQEAMTNLGISNDEIVARQQDQAMRASIRNLALSDIGSNAQGYFKDKSLEKANLDQNTMIMSLLKTGEYEMVDDGKGGFTVKYKGPSAK